MKKLLLLTISMVSILAKDYAAGSEKNRFNRFTYNDSVIRNEAPADPKEGFKDLFIKTAATTTAGYSTSKLNPLAAKFVRDYVEHFSAKLTKMKSWGKPYFDIMNNILAQHGLPTELKYLSVIESALKNYAVSWAGAVGPWQFMPQTARNLGLRVSRYSDERTDFYKSTHAAARYLTQLYGLYGDWLLVIAAYNGGPGNVNAAIRKSGSRNFWDLQYFLPAESRNHVKKFIATHYIMEGDGGITTITKSEAADLLINPPVAIVKETTPQDAETMNISGKYNSIVLSQQIQMNIAEFNRLNPNFDKLLAANGSIDLQLPEDKMLLFQANKPQILEKSIQLMLTMDGK
jgi:membrane-bound lytic murein transglycosylase D